MQPYLRLDGSKVMSGEYSYGLSYSVNMGTLAVLRFVYGFSGFRYWFHGGDAASSYTKRNIRRVSSQPVECDIQLTFEYC